MKTQIIILAAGNSTRMKSETPKVLMEIGGMPMVLRVVDTARETVLDTTPIVIVNERNREAIAHVCGDLVRVVVQKEQLGTAHAVQSAKYALESGIERIVVLYGDHPFITPTTIQRLIESCSAQHPVSMVTFSTHGGEPLHEMLADFGRIIRNAEGKVRMIREMKDASDDERTIAEKNPGYYCFDAAWLWENIAQLENANVQQEYYLTDLISRAVEQGYEIVTVKPGDVFECIGVNNPEQLAWARARLTV